jgi:hypothetical protein
MPALHEEVSWAVWTAPPSTFSVALREDDRVAEAKCAIAVLREVSQFAMELFVKREEEPLDDERQLISAEKAPLFMLMKCLSDRRRWRRCSSAQAVQTARTRPAG